MSRVKLEKYFLRNYFGGCERKHKQQYKLFVLKIDVSCDYIKRDKPLHFFKEQSLQTCIETFGLGYVIRDDDQYITVVTLEKEKDRLFRFLDGARHKYVGYEDVTSVYNKKIVQDGNIII